MSMAIATSVAGERATRIAVVGKATGPTSGSMRAALDRLERKGYVVRVADTVERRRTFVRVCLRKVNDCWRVIHEHHSVHAS